MRGECAAWPVGGQWSWACGASDAGWNETPPIMSSGKMMRRLRDILPKLRAVSRSGPDADTLARRAVWVLIAELPQEIGMATGEPLCEAYFKQVSVRDRGLFSATRLVRREASDASAELFFVDGLSLVQEVEDHFVSSVVEAVGEDEDIFPCRMACRGKDDSTESGVIVDGRSELLGD